MIIDFSKKQQRLKLKSLNFKNYDYVIIGTGPSGTVLIDTLLKRNKKLLVIERGNFKKRLYEKIIYKKFKIKNDSRTFAVGGSSLDWSQIYSYYENIELQDRSKLNKNKWPLSHKELIKLYSKLDKKFKFDFSKLNKTLIKSPFKSRKFIAPNKPLNFKNFLEIKKIDLIINCKVNIIDDKKNFSEIYLENQQFKTIINVKKVILCNGGIESTSLILRSLKYKKLQSLKNKNLVGKYFMDHPKGYVGVLKYPKNEILEKVELIKGKKEISYYGFSLNEKDQNNKKLLNSYIRFERQKNHISNIMDPIFKGLKNVLNQYLRIKKLNHRITNQKYNIRVFFEMYPSLNNFLKIDKNEKTIINLNISKKEIDTFNLLINKIYKFFSKIPNKEHIKFMTKKRKMNLNDASHHMGGLVYPKIVNRNLKIRGLNNIYCCSSSIFPTSGSVNPTFTICALALRLGIFLD